MAGAPAAVGDDGRSALHHRLPVGIGHVGDEYIAGLDPVHLRRVLDDAHRAGTDLLADRPARGEDLAVLLDFEFFHHAADLGLDCLRARLEDVQLTVTAVAAPFDVHRPAIVPLDDERITGEFQHILVGEGIALPIGFRHIHGKGGLARLLGLREHHLDHLGTEIAADHRRLSQRQGGLVHIELVGIHRALDHRLAETIAGGDEDHVLEAGLGIDGEQHAGRAGIGAHHALYAGGKGNLGMGEALVYPVGNRTIVVQRGKHLLDRVQDIVVAVNVEKGLLLPGKGGIGQVFGGRRRTHGEGRIRAAAGDQFVIELANILFELRRKRRVDDPLADFRAALEQFVHIVHVQMFQRRTDAFGQSLVGEKFPIGICGGGKTAGYAHAGSGQLADHFAQGSVLATDATDIGHAQLFKGNYVTIHGHTASNDPSLCHRA